MWGEIILINKEILKQHNVKNYVFHGTTEKLYTHAWYGVKNSQND